MGSCEHDAFCLQMCCSCNRLRRLTVRRSKRLRTAASSGWTPTRNVTECFASQWRRSDHQPNPAEAALCCSGYEDENVGFTTLSED
jgi:hypothetical protein